MLSYDPTFRYPPDPSSMSRDLSDLDAAEVQYVFGYRLNGNAIQLLTNESQTTSTGNCPDRPWASLTDPNTTNVTSLEFDLETFCLNTTDDDADCATASSGDVLIEKRRVNITLTAEHAQNPDTRIQLEESVAVRNDHVYAAE